MTTETLRQYSLSCSCGFSGAVRVNTLIKSQMLTVQCVGCDTIYKIDSEGNMMEPLTEIPTFDSWEHMEEFLDKHHKKEDTPTGGEKKVSSRKKAGRSSKIKSAIPAKETKAEVDKLFYVAIHFYTRIGDSFGQVMKDAKQESSVRGEGSIIYAHAHHRGEECNEECKEYSE